MVSSGDEAPLWKAVRKTSPGFVFVADGAMERLSSKKEISALAAARLR